MPEFRNMLIVRMSALGDVVDCLPALSALRRALPSARISWIVDDRCSPLLEGHPMLDELITVPRRTWMSGLASPVSAPSILASMLEFYSRQRKRGFDAVFDFQSNLKSGFNSFMTGSEYRIGLSLDDSRECSLLFATHRAPPSPPGTHRVDRNLALVRSAGIPADEAEFVLPRSAGAETRAREFAVRKRSEQGRVILFNPHASAKGGYKRWPIERWRDLCVRTARDFGSKPAILWGPGEKEDAETLCRESGAVLAPPTDLKGLMELFRVSDLLVGADSGPMHVAWALSLPVLALFGPKDPRVYGPYGGRGRAISLGLPCSPCRYTACPDVACMKGIDVESVLQGMKEALDAAAHPGGSRGPGAE